MRKLVFVTLILLVSVGWAVAQQSPASPSATPDQSQQPGAQQPSTQQPSAQPGAPGETGQQPGMPGQQPTTPEQAPQAGQAPSAAGGSSSIEGCLGGSAGNFTVADKSGTTYQLQLPSGADTSKLAQHVGEEVRVSGTMSNASQSAGGQATSNPSGAAAGAGSQPTIAVTKIDKVGDKCGAGGAQSPSNPPSSH